MDNIRIGENERIDDLQIKGYRIIQNTKGFCFGMDAVLLSDYARIRKGAVVMDLCSGTGIIPILLMARYQPGRVSGLEIQESFVEMAGRSMKLNGLSDLIEIRQGDVMQVPDLYRRETYDYVTCNPPYMTGDHGLTNPDRIKAVARHEILCKLSDVVRAAAWLLKPGGHMLMVHRPFRLAEIISCLRDHRLEPKRMRLVYPFIDKEPNMVLIESVKGAKARITVEKPLIIYREPGVYTDEVRNLYYP